MKWILLLICLHFANAQSGIPAIDTLPLHEWDVKTPNKSMTTGLTLGLLLPGGTHYYTGHYVRAGFLTALEVYLLSEIFYNQPLQRTNKKEQASSDFQNLNTIISDLQSNYKDKKALSLIQSRDSLLSSIRRTDDQLEEINGLLHSQKAWLIGLHLYGFMDGYGILRNNIYGHPKEARDAVTAGLWSLLPGFGQLYNHEYGKAGLLYMAFIGSYASFHARQHTVEHYRNRLSVARTEGNNVPIEYLEEKLTFFRKKRNQYIWGPIVFYLYSMADATVDALLSDFDSPLHLTLLPMPDGGVLELSLSF